ncbi:MAG: proline dehydrogenase family protein [Bacteroidales bacterium]
MLKNPRLVAIGKRLITNALKLRLPIGFIIRPLIFRHFCGGESLDSCSSVISRLGEYGVRVIPDFSAEGKEDEEAFDRVKGEVLRTIQLAAGSATVISAVFKPTGIAPFGLWEKLSSGDVLTPVEAESHRRLEQRMEEIFSEAARVGVPVMVDAEESWIQPAVDAVVRRYGERYNIDKVLVYNTLQMYRNDRLAFMKSELVRAMTKGYMLGYKIVRGAYHEKEISRARQLGYPCPVYTKKEETDEAYNAALVYCFENRDRISFCAATHNEQSSLLLAQLLDEHQLAGNAHITFAQLYGMSDNLTFNLAKAGFVAAKYLPYGPVREVIPYLFRRAEENRSIDGQTGRELAFLRRELKRRKET